MVSGSFENQEKGRVVSSRLSTRFRIPKNFILPIAAWTVRKRLMVRRIIRDLYDVSARMVY